MSKTIVIRTDDAPDDETPGTTGTTGSNDAADGTTRPAPFDPNADPDEPDEPEGPVGLGDRFRHLLTSSDQSNPLYPRVLGLKHIHPSAWQRAFLVEGMMIAGGLVALADKATSWAPVILPVAAAAVVKFHDVLAGFLPPRPTHRAEPAGDEAPRT